MPSATRDGAAGRHAVNVDFEFPRWFGSSGLPHYPSNRYLPLRLHVDADHDESRHLDARHREELELEREESRRTDEYYSRRRRRTAGLGRGEEQEEVAIGGPGFPCLVAFILVVFPIAILCVVLGIVLRFVDAK